MGTIIIVCPQICTVLCSCCKLYFKHVVESEIQIGFLDKFVFKEDMKFFGFNNDAPKI